MSMGHTLSTNARYHISDREGVENWFSAPQMAELIDVFENERGSLITDFRTQEHNQRMKISMDTIEIITINPRVQTVTLHNTVVTIKPHLVIINLTIHLKSQLCLNRYNLLTLLRTNNGGVILDVLNALRWIILLTVVRHYRVQG
jgi:hypothetical protein